MIYWQKITYFLLYLFIVHLPLTKTWHTCSSVVHFLSSKHWYRRWVVGLPSPSEVSNNTDTHSGIAIFYSLCWGLMDVLVVWPIEFSLTYSFPEKWEKLRENLCSKWTKVCQLGAEDDSCWARLRQCACRWRRVRLCNLSVEQSSLPSRVRKWIPSRSL